MSKRRNSEDIEEIMQQVSGEESIEVIEISEPSELDKQLDLIAADFDRYIKYLKSKYTAEGGLGNPSKLELYKRYHNLETVQAYYDYRMGITQS